MEEKRTNDTESYKIAYDVVNLYKDGFSRERVNQYLEFKYPNRTDRWRYQRQRDASYLLESEFRLKQNALVNLHLQRYEKIYQQHKDASLYEYAHLRDEQMRIFLVCERLVIAMSALQSKEKLLGLHSKAAKVQINNIFKQQNDQDNLVQYNFSNLNFEDVLKLKNIMSTIRVDTGNEQAVFIVEQPEQTDKDFVPTINIKHKEMPTIAQQLKETIDLVSVLRESATTLEDLKDRIHLTNSQELDAKLTKSKKLIDRLNQLD